MAFVRADILADEVAPKLAADGAAFDVVTAIHLLEHLTAEETVRAMDNLWALTGRRLIVAVPFEAVPDPRFGHRQVFDRESLLALGRHDGRKLPLFRTSRRLARHRSHSKPRTFNGRKSDEL